MENQIVKTSQMSQQHVHKGIAEQEHSSVKTTTAHHQLQFAVR